MLADPGAVSVAGARCGRPFDWESEMKIRIEAYKENEREYGESVKIRFESDRGYVFSAKDIDELIEALKSAKTSACLAEVGADHADFSLDL